jgi:hypothetical protein
MTAPGSTTGTVKVSMRGETFEAPYKVAKGTIFVTFDGVTKCDSDPTTKTQATREFVAKGLLRDIRLKRMAED